MCLALVSAVRVENVVHLPRQGRPWPSDADPMSPSTSIPGSNPESHDGARQRLRLRLSVSTQETMRSFAGARGVSQAGLLDALLHGLESADPDWLRGVIDQARRNDADHRSEDATSAP